MNPETLREHAKTIRLTYAFPDRLNEAADAWEADLGRFYDVGNALQNAGFMPLGNDYAASVDAMSKRLEAAEKKSDMSERIVLYGGVVGDYDGAYDWIKESDYGRPENSPGFHECYPGPSYTVLEVVAAALAGEK